MSADKKPVLLVDTDATLSLDEWSDLITGKPPNWPAFFMHVADAPVRRAEMLDLLTFAKDSGALLRFSSRWPDMVRPLFEAALHRHGAQCGYTWWRRDSRLSAVQLAAVHARAAGRSGPVVMIHNSADTAGDLRREFGIACIGVDQIPTTTQAITALLSHARPVPEFELPAKKLKGTAA